MDQWKEVKEKDVREQNIIKIRFLYNVNRQLYFTELVGRIAQRNTTSLVIRNTKEVKSELSDDMINSIRYSGCIIDLSKILCIWKEES